MSEIMGHVPETGTAIQGSPTPPGRPVLAQPGKLPERARPRTAV